MSSKEYWILLSPLIKAFSKPNPSGFFLCLHADDGHDQRHYVRRLSIRPSHSSERDVQMFQPLFNAITLEQQPDLSIRICFSKLPTQLEPHRLQNVTVHQCECLYRSYYSRRSWCEQPFTLTICPLLYRSISTLTGC